MKSQVSCFAPDAPMVFGRGGFLDAEITVFLWDQIDLLVGSIERVWALYEQGMGLFKEMIFQQS